MKKLSRNLFLVIFAISLFIPSVVYFGMANVSSTVTAEETRVNLSNHYRETYISSDNVGYTSTTKEDLFFDPLIDLSVSSTKIGDSEAFEVDETSDKGVPVVRIDEAKDFFINIEFADKIKGSVIYDWSTSARTSGTYISKKYTLNHDSWGVSQTGDSKQTVSANGLKLTTGEIGTGALVIQVSEDGTSWKNVEKDKYANGLYTTDLLKYYHGTTQNYTLDGMDIKKGVYVSVSFFYEASYVNKYYYTTQERYWYQHLLFGIPIGGTHTVEHIEDRTDCINVRETIKFFVAEDDTEIATFNNLTTADTSEIVEVAKPSSSDEAEFKLQSEQYNNYLNAVINQLTPTMYDGDMTTTGFRINVTANPYIDVTLKRNGEDFALPELRFENEQYFYEIIQAGKYDITISSYSKQKSITLYVDNVDANEVYQRYFGKQVIHNAQVYGDEFLDYSPNNQYGNMRIFDANSDVPVFINELTLNLKTLSDENVLPLYGMVTNKSTGKTYVVESTQIKLTEFGEYEVMLCTNADYYESVVLGNSHIKMAGDVRVYKFNFKLVGKDSDTTVNHQLLSTSSFGNLSVASPSDYVPMFYSVTRRSTDKGRILVAFADRASALKYAKTVAWSEIEICIDQDNNTYWKIPNLNNPLGDKVISYSGWQNAQVVNALAEQMVEEKYFDLTEYTSYLTLEKSVEDLEQEDAEFTNLDLEALKKSVIIWYSAEQRSTAIANNAKLNDIIVAKFVGKQNTAVLSKDEQGKYSNINESNRDYHFVKDMLGIDSYTLTATDVEGNELALNYEQGLYEQLVLLGCKSGLFLITEKTIYGNVSAEYYIYFIEEGYQPAKMLLDADGTQLQVSADEEIIENCYDVVVIQDISDYVDPYAYVRIKCTKNNITTITYYSITQVKDLVISDSGSYEIAVIDRFGNNLQYKFHIN